MKSIFLTNNTSPNIATRRLVGKPPTVVFMPGFFSSMEGTKATFLEKMCRNRGQAYIRFDYRGHGQSGGKFEDSTISDWLNDTLLVLDSLAKSPVLAVGSSMGGWIALLAALKRPQLIKGIVGIASAPDFTRSIYQQRLTDIQRIQIDQKGFLLQQSRYQEEPLIISKKLINDGDRHLLLTKKTLNINIPVCLIHGGKDEDVSWKKSETLQRIIGDKNCELILIPDGSHRLSRQKDLELIDQKVRNISRLLS